MAYSLLVHLISAGCFVFHVVDFAKDESMRGNVLTDHKVARIVAIVAVIVSCIVFLVSEMSSKLSCCEKLLLCLVHAVIIVAQAILMADDWGANGVEASSDARYALNIVSLILAGLLALVQLSLYFKAVSAGPTCTGT
eukprot:m.66281 g.66281  ORF g.66281 m.66281 type:complete len:138 (+) comp7392_c0_seq1:67-480(+)